MTLTIDCGGGGIKASVLDAAGTMRAQPVRVPTPYPLPPDLFVKTLLALGAVVNAVGISDSQARRGAAEVSYSGPEPLPS